MARIWPLEPSLEWVPGLESKLCLEETPELEQESEPSLGGVPAVELGLEPFLQQVRRLCPELEPQAELVLESEGEPGAGWSRCV